MSRGILSRGFCLGGFCPRGDFVQGILSGGFCPGGFCPDTVVFIDFKKAFDTVPHEVLSYRLQVVGITGNLHQWIMDYLSERTQYTEINGSRFETAHIKCGVLQGSQLGQRLYSIDVNDFSESVDACDLSILSVMHQIYYDNTQTDIKCLFFKKEQNGYDTRKKLQFEVQRYRGPLIWNSLPNELKKRQKIKAVTSCSTHKIDQQETDG